MHEWPVIVILILTMIVLAYTVGYFRGVDKRNAIVQAVNVVTRDALYDFEIDVRDILSGVEFEDTYVEDYADAREQW